VYKRQDLQTALESATMVLLSFGLVVLAGPNFPDLDR